jgi:hypothetical protein
MPKFDPINISTEPWSPGATTETVCYAGNLAGNVMRDKDGQYRWSAGTGNAPGKRVKLSGPYETLREAAEAAAYE